MKKERNTAEIIGSDGEFDIEPSGSEGQQRTLILKAPPRSRKGELMAKGAKEIRCINCNQIKSLAGAEESGEGWVCKECVQDMTQNLNTSPKGKMIPFGRLSGR